jgi:predicted alpha/beta superfamily hydrolase
MILLSYCLPQFTAVAQVKIIVEAIPSTTPLDESIYLTGNFNQWNPKDEKYRLVKQADDTFMLHFTTTLKDLEFKFTRGSWQTVEGDEEGKGIHNRQLTYKNGETTRLKIVGWEQPKPKKSTAGSNVRIIDQNFKIPQLDRERRIWLCLPHDYATSKRKYPVLYMHDGQNLFDDSTAFAGEWGIDNFLAEQKIPLIVVGIDNGQNDRMQEYTAWENPRFGKPEGAAFAQFIVETLKPFIDKNYRTLTDKQHTGVAGSSMGGLITFYMGLKYPQVFGKVAVLSPSFWFSEYVYTFAESRKIDKAQKLVFLVGGKESPAMVGDTEKMVKILKKSGVKTKNIALMMRPEGTHSEGFWRQEFPAVYQFLFE